MAWWRENGQACMKTRVIHTLEEADALNAALSTSAGRALEQLGRQLQENSSLHVLASIKFRPIGRDPLDADRPLNLIEQVNQTFTYLASIRAVKKLMELHPDLAPFTLNLGTASGSDIESCCGALAAEVFAAVNTSNNRKLASDLKKVSQTSARYKYVFFMCPDIGPGPQPRLGRQWGVEVWSVGDEI